MTASDGRARGSAAAPRPTPAFGTFLATAVAAVTLLWLPLSVMPILDGLLFVATPLETVRDLGLLSWLGFLTALVLAALATLTVRAARVFGFSEWRAGLAGWVLLLLPLTWAIGWHAARMAWQWLRAMTSINLPVGQSAREAMVVLMVASLGALVWRLSLATLVRRVASALTAAAPLAGLILIAAALVVAWYPPVLLQSAPDLQARPVASDPPDIFLISLDAVAAIDADACNPHSATMPRLARFASGATCFARFYAASNFTTPTTSTMESGVLPWTHFATQPDALMAGSTRQPTLPSTLQALGWRTHSITDNLLASPRHRGTWEGYTSTGFAHTTLFGNWFRVAMTVFPDTALPRLASTAVSFLGAFDMALHGERSPYASEQTYKEVLSLLAREGRRAPLFVWAHTLPPHSPYLAPPSTKYALLPRGELETWAQLMPDNEAYPPARQALVDKHRLRYRESMMAADAALGTFLDELDRQGRLEAALVVITSDHGESFEKGYLGHAGPLTHDSLTRVPFVLKLPGQKLGRIVQAPVSQADLAPTLLDLAGAPPLPHAEGRSLRALLDGISLPSQPVFTMTMERQSRFLPLSKGHYAVIEGNEKLTLDLDAAAGKAPVSFFDLGLDPSETKDLAAERPQRARELESLLRRRLAAAEHARSVADRAP